MVTENFLSKAGKSLTAIFLFIGLFSISAATTFASSGPQTSTYISPIKSAPIVFSAVAASWDQKIPTGSIAQISLRFYENGTWGDWYLLEPDIDGKTSADPNHPTSFIALNAAQNFQYKVFLQGESKNPPVIENLQFTYINSAAPAANPQPSSGNLFAASMPATDQTSSAADQSNLNTNLDSVNIITRAEWGADESLRIYNSSNAPATKVISESSDYMTKFADELKIIKTITTDAQGNLLTWPEDFPAHVTKIIIHHTASTQDLADPMKAIRDIYYFHAITRGWGDIGYNYLIDPEGNIYEGRAGGDGVVGAHAGPGNVGSIGIAILGNYQDNDVPEPVLHSLVALIKEKTQEYNIDPLGNTSFRGQNLPNIMGHRDIESTTCPGDKLYAELPEIRLAVESGFNPVIINRGPNLTVNQKYDFQVGQSVPLFQFDPSEQQNISVTLKNTGQTSWGKNTFIMVNRNDNANNYFMIPSPVRSSAAGQVVAPGQDATFTFQIQSGYTGGFTNIEVFPMIDGVTKVEKYLSLPVVIKPAVFDYEVTGLTLPQPYMKVGDVAQVSIALKNTGNTTWEQSGVNHFALGADNPRDHINKLLLKPSNRLALLQEQEVKPGDTGHLVFQIKAPAVAGPYNEFFTPLIEGVTWFENKNNQLNVYVYKNQYEGILASQSLNDTVSPGNTKTVWFEMQNAGGVVWNQGTDNLSYDLGNRSNLQINGPTLQQGQVAPGQTAHISLDVTAPGKIGTYIIKVRPKIGGNYLLTNAVSFALHVQNNAGSFTAAPATSTQQPTQQSSAASTGTDPTIRIGLSFQGNPVIAGNGNFHVEAGGEILASFSANQSAAVTYNNGQYLITSGTQKYSSSTPPRFIPDPGTILQIQNWNRTSPSDSSVLLNQFRGILEADWYNGQLVTINELPIEDYLKGTGETKDSQPYEKLKAIMVVSRSYANFYVKMQQKFPGAPYNLADDPVTSQKYTGYGEEQYDPNTQRAIVDTTGQVVTYQGNIIKTPYFSSDAGQTNSAQEVWGWTNTPWLISVPDPYCAGMSLSGHGVGLSGCGSLGMASAGKTYDQIIQYYYQGVAITKEW